MKHLRPKLTYANVISTVCLFLLLAGGTAFAAAEILPKGSVGTKQLKNGAVTGKKVKPGSLTASDFAPKQLPEGARGPAGPAGAKGAAGEKGAEGPRGASSSSAGLEIERVSATVAPSTSEVKEMAAVCPSGKVLGGGFVTNQLTGTGVLRATRSYAISDGEWFVRARNTNATDDWELTVVAVCAK
jgi:hypothetical protein